MKFFNHINAKTIHEAITLLEENPGRTRLIAGGTDLIGVLKSNILPVYPELLINIKTIPGMDSIKQTKNLVKIGALTRLADIVENPLIVAKYRVLAMAARSIATAEIRNMGTIGGNLCQDIRCMYYRYPHQIGERLLCWRKGKNKCLAVSGDNRYHAVMGGKKCFAVCPSDAAVALAALDASIKITGPNGARKIPVKDFYNPLGNDLNSGEIITEIEIPQIPECTQEFIKFTLRKPIDFAIASIAVVMKIEANICKYVSIALGGIAPAPVRATAAEEIITNKAIDEKTAIKAAEAAIENARSLSMNAYKIELTKALAKKIILSMSEKSRSAK